MATIEIFSKYCFLCTKLTTPHRQLNSVGDEEKIGQKLLGKLISEFNILTLNSTIQGAALVDNWSLCQNCLPDVQSAVQSKENVDKVECQVRKLQMEILKGLRNLVVETGRMYEDVRKIQQIIGRRPSVPQFELVPGVPMQIEDKELIGIFKEKISNVVRDLEEFSKLTSIKVLNNVEPEPEIKAEPKDELGVTNDPDDSISVGDRGQLDNWPDFDTSFNEPSGSEINRSLNSSPAVAAASDEENGPEFAPSAVKVNTRKRKSVKRRRGRPRKTPEVKIKRIEKIKRIKKKVKPVVFKETSSEHSDSDNQDQGQSSSDEDFDPETQRIFEGKKITSSSSLRSNLINRIKYARTISTSSDLPPPEKNDPRTPYRIKYNSTTKQFFIENFEFIVNDPLQSLECKTCDFTIDKVKIKQKSAHLEDVIFDHICGAHLKIYICINCGNSFELLANLTKHIKMMHSKKVQISEKEKFICEICGKPFKSNYVLRDHRWTHLSEEEKKDPQNEIFMPGHVKLTVIKGIKFECEICGKICSKKTNLESHKKSHLDIRERQEEMVICSGCGIEMLKISLNSHLKRCEEQVKKVEARFVKCLICGMIVRSGRELENHGKEKHPEGKVHECTICGKRFRQRAGMYSHRLTHKGERRFVCDRCGVGYTTREHLKRHLKTSGCGKN